MNKFPTVKVNGNALSVEMVEIDQMVKEKADQAELERDAERYRYVRTSMGVTPEQFDAIVDEHLKEKNETE